ncbi:MAG: hypothetical protein IPG06_02385 [Haliea sp.]|nr:hypothetical protein [Haliea sp.]
MDDTVAIDLTGLSAATDMRPLPKSLFIGMDTIDYNEEVMHGGNAPWMNFKVGENPNSIFINFEFTDRAHTTPSSAATFARRFLARPYSHSRYGCAALFLVLISTRLPVAW